MADMTRWRSFSARFGTPEQDELDFADPPTVAGTGIPSLDAVLVGGLAPGAHVLMAAPGSGKSALALHIAMSVASNGGNVLYASTEMTRQQCLARCSSAMTQAVAGLTDFYWSAWEQMGRQARREMAEYRLESDEQRLDFLSRYPAVRAMRELRRACPGLAIADGPEVSGASELARTCAEGREAGLHLVVVDYLQRLRPPKGMEREDQYRQLKETSAALAETAKGLGVPMLVISSMNREGMRSGKPAVTGARGAGDIEYDAVTVWQLTKDAEQEGIGGTRTVALHVLKNRRGPVTDEDEPIRLLFDPRHNVFSEVDR